MLGVVTEVTVKLIPKPACAQVVMASFASVEAAGNAVTQVIAAGMIPAGLEMMDRRATHMVEPFVRAGYDMDAQAILLCESDGTPEEVAHEIARMEAVFRDAGATRCQVSASEAERLKFWAGRKNAFPAAGRVSPDYYCMDGTIPRRHLARVLGAIEQMEDDFGLRCANVFHAGDGNLHPLILFDSNKPDEVERAEIRRRHTRTVRAGWRNRDGRTRRRNGENKSNVRAILARRTRRVPGGQAGVRPAVPAQP